MNQTFCAFCSREITREEICEFDDQILCLHCIDGHTVTCTCCDKRLWHDSNYGDSETPLCEDCY